MPLSAPMAAALEGAHVLLFTAVEAVLPGATLRLLDGAGTVTFAGRTFVGQDPDLGVLASVEPVSDGGEEAPSLRIALLPPTNAAAATLALPQAQGGSVLVWIGVADPTTGGVIGDPELVFAGEIDVPVLEVGHGTRLLTLDCVSIFDRFFEDREGVRLTNAFHQSVWPGELGLEFVTGVKRQMPWGSDQVRPAAVRDSLL